MKICHITSFAPNRCGLYEASRDMAKADILHGNHTVYMVDGRSNENVGKVDDRNGFKVTIASPDLIMDCDLIYMHTGADDRYIVKSQAPIICVVHGKPLDCFRPESKGDGSSYSLYEYIAQWPRTKKMLYFWEDYRYYWKHLFFGKDEVFKYPVIDEDRFNENCNIYDLTNKGKINVLICDSIRADTDLFETAIACINIAKKFKGVKFHFVGLEQSDLHCWKTILNELSRLGALGDVTPRLTDMQSVYRAVDLVLSPNRIINRVVAESLCCGTSVMQETGGETQIADYFCYMPAPTNVLEIFGMFVDDFNKGIDKEKIITRSKVFNLQNYYTSVQGMYKEMGLI
jgi:glycosyltransferase involved in cell wall biosynthesis